MINDLVRCSEQTENKAMKRTNLRTRRTPACRFIAGEACAKLPIRSGNAGLHAPGVRWPDGPVPRHY
jgi:hypothetical protein